ncbi:DegV family protein [Peptoniphilus asaccharolyticus]
MSYRIVADTSCDISPELEEKLRVLLVSFKIAIEGVEYVDDENLDLNVFMEAMKASKNPIRTSCPSPYDYIEKLNECEEDRIIIVTISELLSGSNNAAVIAREEYLREHPDKQVYIVNSKTASAGQLSLILKIDEIMKEEISFEAQIEKIEEAVGNNETFFILENLDNLIKNGRIKKATGLIATALNIRPIMKADKNGDIEIHEINRGFKKSLLKLAKELGSLADNLEERILVISHAEGLEKAQMLADKVKELHNFKDILIVHTKGLATGYADMGGIIVGF